ncbi:MAG: recombinase family protein [Alicyclobacillus sp.]|nr:recombinase family protein [Alicyclobacillus sp.]
MATGIYARVSTEEQARSGYSIASQLRECRKKAGFDSVIEYVDEGYSGEFLERPALTRLRNDVQSGMIRRVICYDPDRLSRKLVHQLMVTEEIERRAELVFVNGAYARTPEGQLFYQLRGAIAEFEKAKINERMTRGRLEKARQGRILRDFHVYGYDYDKQRQQLVVNPREARIVQLVFDLWTKPNSLVRGTSGIARYLNEHAIPTKRGGSCWTRQVIVQMLRNKAYIGEFYQNKWDTRGMIGNRFKTAPGDKVKQRLRPPSEWIRTPVPPIIDSAQFAHAQALLDESKRRYCGRPKRIYLLSGLLRCDECGNTMTGRYQKNWSHPVRQYSDRKRHAGAKNPGCGNTVLSDLLEERVWDTIAGAIREMGSGAEIAAAHGPETCVEDAEIERIQEAIVRNRTLQDRLYALLQDAEVDPADVKEQMRRAKEARERLEARLLDLRRLQRPTGAERRTTLAEAWEQFRALQPDGVPLDCKQEVIRSLVREIRVSRRGQTVDIYPW